MRHEWQGAFGGVLSITSVLVALGAAILATFVKGGAEAFALSTAVAAAIAAVAATLAIISSRRLTREREQRGVFLIYAREDLASAQKIAERLRHHGFKPWLDVEELDPGQVWQKAVIRALERSAAAVVLVSEHLAKRGFVQQELRVALDTLQAKGEDATPIIPVRIDDSPVPEALSHIHWVNLWDENGMDRLVAGLARVT